jgi:4-amino-4-deoxy-L-arabinose transferase-like glycosyltransferase
LFLPQGLRLAWENRNFSWAKLVLVWSGIYLLTISIMGTKLPWYVFPIYPAVALVVGVQLAQVWNMPRPAFYPRAWVAFLALMAVGATCGSLYFGWSPASDAELQLILVAAAGTMTLATILAAQGDRQFLLILFWGMYVSLLLLMTSRHWVWELAEAYPVKPVAAMIQSNTPANQKIYTSYPYGRPSLNFYSDRQIIPATTSELQQHWQQQKPYLLLDNTFDNLTLESVKQVDTAAGWTLITKGNRE